MLLFSCLRFIDLMLLFRVYLCRGIVNVVFMFCFCVWRMCMVYSRFFKIIYGVVMWCSHVDHLCCVDVVLV